MERIFILVISLVFASSFVHSEIKNDKLIYQQTACTVNPDLICDKSKDYSNKKDLDSTLSSCDIRYCYKIQLGNELTMARERIKKRDERLESERELLAKETERKRELNAKERERKLDEKIDAFYSKLRKVNSSEAYEIASTVNSGLFLVEYFAIGQDMEATYQNENDSTEQREIPNFWYKKMKLSKGAYVYLSVQNQSKYGAVEIFIKVNGKEFKHAISDTDYGIASAGFILSNVHRDFLY